MGGTGRSRPRSSASDCCLCPPDAHVSQTPTPSRDIEAPRVLVLVHPRRPWSGASLQPSSESRRFAFTSLQRERYYPCTSYPTPPSIGQASARSVRRLPPSSRPGRECGSLPTRFATARSRAPVKVKPSSPDAALSSPAQPGFGGSPRTAVGTAVADGVLPHGSTAAQCRIPVRNKPSRLVASRSFPRPSRTRAATAL